MAFIGTFSRALLESATAVYFGGVPVSLLDAQGNVILGEGLPEAPTITSTIADRTYAAGDAAVTVDLRTKFSGATSYTVSPDNAAVTIDGYTLTISPTAPMSQTTFAVRGINGGGSSDPLTFKLTITAPVPELLQPLPDQSLLIGGGTVTLPLAEYFSGAAGYAVSPANSGVTISNGNLVISRTTARDVIITVTATNATGQGTSDSFALLIGAPVNLAPVASAVPEQSPVANVSFTADLSGYFEDPNGDPLIFDYTGTLPTGITRTGAVFSGTATVTGQTASGVLRARDPGNLEAEAPVTWAVAAQPTLQATITPDPLVAGEDFEIVIDPAPDSVSPLTLVRDADDPRRYTGTAPDSGTLAIGATKAGYQPFAQTYTYDPAPVVEPGSITVESDGTISIALPDSVTEPFDAQIAGEVVTIDPAAYVPTSAPVALGQPDIAGRGGDGETLTVTGRALFAGHASAGVIALAAGWYRNDTAIGDTDTSYTQDDAVDGDRTLTFRETATNTAGSTVAVSNGILCPAPVGEPWWYQGAGLVAHLDLANNRARVGSTTYNDLDAALQIGANGAEYIPISGLGSVYALAVTARTPAEGDTATRNIVTLDDGDDGVADDNLVALGQRLQSGTYMTQFYARADGADAYNSPNTPALTHDTLVRMAFRLKQASYRRTLNGSGATGTSNVAPPSSQLTRLVIGNRSAGDRAWTGQIYQILLVNADLNDTAIGQMLSGA